VATKPEGEYTFYGKVNQNHELGTGVELVSDKMSYIILRGRWCHIIVLNIHATTKGTIFYVKNSIYEEMECVFDEFPK
jgi:hypothetical protein